MNNQIIKTDNDPYEAIKKEKPGTYTVMDKAGKKVRKVLTKCGESKVEQHHVTEIKKLVAQTEAQGLLRANTQFQGEMDDYPEYDFQEAQFMIARARSMFEQLPSQLRLKFENNPAKFMDHVKTASKEQLAELGLQKTHDNLRVDGSVINKEPTTDTSAAPAAPAPEPSPTTG